MPARPPKGKPRPKRPGRLPPGVREVRPGYYQAEVMLAGQRLRRSGTDPAALDRWRRDTKRRGSGGLPDVDRDRTLLRDHLRAWLEGRRGTIGAKEWGNQERYAALHVAPALGHLELRHVRADHLRALYGTLQLPPPAGAGLAPKTVREVHYALRLALQQAVDDGWLAANVAAAVRPPRPAVRTAQRVLTPDELRRFWRLADGHRLAALWRLAAHFPSRSGELRSLRWDDYDARSGLLVVRRSVEASGDAGRVLQTKAPKTRAGVRPVELDAALVRALAEHRARQAAERLAAGPAYVARHDLIFCARYGTPLLAGNVLRAFRRLLAAAGVSEPQAVRFHDLRHTSISSMLAAGVPLAEVSAIAGHASPAITSLLYTHAVRRGRRTALDDLAAFYRDGDDGAAEGEDGSDGGAAHENHESHASGAAGG